MFEPIGPHAEVIARLGWGLLIGGTVIFAVIMTLVGWAAFGTRRRWLAGSRAIVVGGIAFPFVVLFGLLVGTLAISARIVESRSAPAVRIELIGEQWWWRVHYLDASGRLDFATANELTLPIGLPIELVLRSNDVIHSFWVPSLAGKLDMIPGIENRMRVRADRAAVVRGQCAEFCGGPHAQMALYVVTVPAEAFEIWREEQRTPLARPVANVDEMHGRALFLAHCAVCHAVRGTAAGGARGPDLTHVASRLSLGAGILPMSAESLERWIAGSQRIKPENLMPSFDRFDAQELHSVAAWLASLR